MLKEIMTKNVISVPQTVTIIDVAKIMARENISSVAVTDDGGVEGIISETDIIRHIGDKDWKTLTAGQIMTPGVETVRPETTLFEAAEFMNEKKIHRLLIFERGKGEPARAIGVVSAGDIVRKIAKL